MDKKELFKQLSEQKNMSEDDFKEIWKGMKREIENEGREATDGVIIQRITGYLLPLITSPAVKLEGIFLGIEDDFGLNKWVREVETDSINAFKDDPDEAIREGFVSITKDGEGKDIVIPLWHEMGGKNISEKRLGQPITANDYSATATLFVKSDNEIKLQQIKLRGKRKDNAMNNASNLIGKKVNFNAVVRDDGTLGDSKYTEFTIIEDKVQPVLKLINKIAPDSMVDMTNIGAFYSKHAENINNTVVFATGFISSIVVSATSTNNIINVVGEEGVNVSVFLPKVLGIPQEKEADVLFGGKLRKRENVENSYSINAFMWMSTGSKKAVIPDLMKKYMTTEETQDVATSKAKMEEDSKKEEKIETPSKPNDDDWGI